jgi:hypothetical protein
MSSPEAASLSSRLTGMLVMMEAISQLKISAMVPERALEKTSVFL